MDEITNFRGEVVSEPGHGRAGAEAFIAAVGDRVRLARQRRGLSRRLLSERSGVSQRYLAQLEGGEGNISIALLWKVARALDHRIEWLVGEDDPWGSDVQRFAALYRSASGEQRRAAERILDPGGTGSARQSRLCLIGLRGAGKSTLGRLLAAELSLPFEELNQRIEEQGGMPVEDIIALYGQEGYRRLEHQALERIVAASDAVVLAVAGGIVAERETFAFLLRHFHTVWLRATPEEHMARVRAQGDERPMAGNPKAMEDLRAILASREALYARAGAAIDTTGLGLRESLAHLREAVARLGVPSA